MENPEFINQMKNMTFDIETKEELLKIILRYIHKSDKINKTQNISSICESVNSIRKNESLSTLYDSKRLLSGQFNFTTLNDNDMEIDFEPEMKLNTSKMYLHEDTQKPNEKQEKKESNLEHVFQVRKDYGKTFKNEAAQDVNSSDDEEDESEDDRIKTRKFFESQLGIDVK